MQTLFRVASAFAVVSIAWAAFFGAALSAAANMYSADIEGVIKLTDEQKPQVQRILRQSETEILRILKAKGIDPDDNSPNAMQLYSASAALSELGQRTRSKLAEILDAEQLKQYDRITADVEQRIRSSVKAPERPNMSEMR